MDVNKFLEPSFIMAVMGGVGVIATAIFTYLGTRRTKGTDLAIADRQQLSKDEQEFRQGMKDEITRLNTLLDKERDRANQLEKDNIQLQKQLAEVQIELLRLKVIVEKRKDEENGQ